MNKDPAQTLSDNLLWLMEKRGKKLTQAAVGEKSGVDQKTVGRVLAASNSATIGTIAALAKAFSLEAWQMVAPRLGADLYKIDNDRRVVPVIVEAPPLPDAKRIDPPDPIAALQRQSRHKPAPEAHRFVRKKAGGAGR